MSDERLGVDVVEAWLRRWRRNQAVRRTAEYVDRQMPASPASVPVGAAWVLMLVGWILYADEHFDAYESRIGDDGVLGQEWADIGNGLAGLLNGMLTTPQGFQLDAAALSNLLDEVRTLNEVELE